MHGLQNLNNVCECCIVCDCDVFKVYVILTMCKYVSTSTFNNDVQEMGNKGREYWRYGFMTFIWKPNDPKERKFFLLVADTLIILSNESFLVNKDIKYNEFANIQY